MPAETIVVVSAIVAVFVFFAAVATYGDMTWSKVPQRKDAGQH